LYYESKLKVFNGLPTQGAHRDIAERHILSASGCSPS